MKITPSPFGDQHVDLLLRCDLCGQKVRMYVDCEAELERLESSPYYCTSCTKKIEAQSVKMSDDER